MSDILTGLYRYVSDILTGLYWYVSHITLTLTSPLLIDERAAVRQCYGYLGGMLFESVQLFAVSVVSVSVVLGFKVISHTNH